MSLTAKVSELNGRPDGWGVGGKMNLFMNAPPETGLVSMLIAKLLISKSTN